MFKNYIYLCVCTYIKNNTFNSILLGRFLKRSLDLESCYIRHTVQTESDYGVDDLWFIWNIYSLNRGQQYWIYACCYDCALYH